VDLSVDDLKARAADADQDRRAHLNQCLRPAFIDRTEEDDGIRGVCPEGHERTLVD